MSYAPTVALDIALSVAVIFWAFSYAETGRRFLHLLQLEDYDPLRMLTQFVGRPVALQPFIIDAVGAFLVANGLRALVFSQDVAGGFPHAFIYGGMAVWVGGVLFRRFTLRQAARAAKKPLVMTARARRIWIISMLVGVAVMAVMLFGHGGYWRLWVLPAMFLTERFMPVWMAAGVALLWPQERAAQKLYIHEARQKLDEVKPLVIGITGSYGKTGTKEILAALLATKYNLLRPPGSYNTLMGVTRVIREELRPYHEALVVEMGAYRRGSIAKLCELAKPTHGIITIIGVQHLERFGSQREIKLAKSELIQALPAGGIAVLNGDDSLCREIGAERVGEKIYFGMGTPPYSPPQAGGNVVVRNIEIGVDGSRFEIVYPDGEAQRVKLSLLGRGAVMNAAAAVALADKLGVGRRDIAQTLSDLPHVKHRLEPIKRGDGVTIIDDAYNSNPVGAAGALEVLAKVSSGRRVLVTPGMVELGELEQDANFAFGKQAAAACDLAVLIGPGRSRPIRNGLIAAGFPPEQIWVEASIGAALSHLQSWLKPGDVMLLENDLPDQYSE